jgi:hypothetical protein
MPPLPSPGSVLRVEFETGGDASQPAGSRFYLQYSSGPPDTADLNTLASAVSAAWGTHIAPRVANTEKLESVTITDLSSDTGAVGTWEGTVDGTNSGAPLIASAAALVNHVIARRYRGGRPRTYVRAGTATDLENENTWSSTFLGEMLTAWQAWIAEILATTGIGITSLQIVNVGYYEGFLAHEYPSGRYKNIAQLRKVDGVPTPNVDPVTSSTVATKIGSQRRRLDI